MKSILMDNSYIALLQDYSDKPGAPVARFVSDDLFDRLGNVAPVTLEQCSLAPLKFHCIARASNATTTSPMMLLDDGP